MLFREVYIFVSVNFDRRLDDMEVITKLFWFTAFIWISSSSATEFEESVQEVTTEPLNLSSFPTTTFSPETPPTDNGMAIGDILEDVKADSPLSVVESKEENTGLGEEPLLVSFPDNHKNFTASQYLGNNEQPPYYNLINSYQQQYKNYYDQKALFNTKPIKFEENSQKNFYIPQGSSYTVGSNDLEKTTELVPVKRKPFPYTFESGKISDNWYQNTAGGQIPLHEEPNTYLVYEHPQNVHPYYAFPYKKPYEPKYYKNELHHHHEHHDVTKEDKAKTHWNKVLNVLTALVPLGLFLATLTPNVISINSTANTKTTRQRSVEVESPSLKFKEEDLMRVLQEYGVESLNESECEDRIICELARRGNAASANSIEKGFWYLANETPWDVAENAGMNELFQAIKTGNCESFKCESTPEPTKNPNFSKKVIKKPKI